MNDVQPVLRFDNVHFSYDPSLPEIIHGVSFELAPKSFTVIVGPSGSGKSTILLIAIGLDKPAEGSVSLSARTRMIFQSGALLPWATVLENVLIGFTGLSVSEAEQKKRAMEALKELGIDMHASDYPRALSGGQRQRVGVARALVSEPELMLLDEPFSALDIETSERLAHELLAIAAKKGMTMLMVSHSIDDAVMLADRIFVFKGGVIASETEVTAPRPRKRGDAYIELAIEKVKRLLPGE